MATRIINGTNGNDLIVGRNSSNSNNPDILNGLDGDDRIFGQAGNDVLNGDEGNDTITGGTGNDDFLGGTGVDTYSYLFDDLTDGIDTFVDRIRDFSSVDILDLSALDVELNDITFAEVGNNTFVSVDVDGTVYDIARLDGVDGLDAQTLFDDGLLII